MNFDTTLILAVIFILSAILLPVLLGKLSKKPKEGLTLSNLGWYWQGAYTYNLSEYYVDKSGQLYSFNSHTWERNKSKDKDILICSNNTTNKNGDIINTLRTTSGIKVTVKRKDLKFDEFKMTVLEVRNTTPRHLKVLSKIA